MAFRIKLMFAFIAGWAAVASGQRVITLNRVELSGSIVQLGPRSVAFKTAGGQIGS